MRIHKTKKPATKLWPSSYQHYFEICHVMDLYTHYAQAYTQLPIYNRYVKDNYRSHRDWNYFFKAHAYMKELGCPPEVYLEGVFTQYKPSYGKEVPYPNMLKYYSFLVMQYLKTAKVSYGNFYQIPDGPEDDMAKQIGRGVINYFRLDDFIPESTYTNREELAVTSLPGSFDDYFIVATPGVFLNYCENKDYIIDTFPSRHEDLSCKLEYFKVNFTKYEQLVALKRRVTDRVNEYLTKNSNKDRSQNLSDIQRELEDIKYNI